MCESCGCVQSDDDIIIRKPGENISPLVTSQHHHDHSQQEKNERIIRIEQDVLSKNNQIASRNRAYFEDNSILALNLVSSPGSGKTAILEKTITALIDIPLAVIEGDQQTLRDAERIEATGAPVVQVNTGNGCHLDADMVHRAMHLLELRRNSILFIENVGNLVCPAQFDLGEAAKVVIISVTEGEDKPQKYPNMFHAADLCLINKIDLLPYVDFDIDRCRKYASQVNNRLTFIELSAVSGHGMDTWLGWLRRRTQKLQL